MASSITAALTRLTQNQEYGYAAREGVLAEAFVRRIERRLLKGRFGRRIPSRLLGSPGVTGVAIGADVPGVTMRVPEATYLAWPDCHALDLPCSAGGFFLDHARVGLNFGGTRAAISGCSDASGICVLPG